MNKKIRRASLVAAMMLVGAAFCTAATTTGKALSPQASSVHPSTTCTGGASLAGSYGMLVNGNGKLLSGTLKFDGNCNVSGANISGGSSGKYTTTSVTGTYGQNADGTFALTLNFANHIPSQTYIIGVSESGYKARGIESDGTVGATIDIQSQLTSLTSGYITASLNGTYAASCFGGGYADLDYLNFDGNGNVSGLEYFDVSASLGNKSLSGTYSVNGDGTFAGTFAGGYSFNGVIDNGVSEIEYTYASGSYGITACVGKQAAPSSNLLGNYGFVVGGSSAGGYGDETLSGTLFFDGAGNVSGTNVNGGINTQYGNTSAVGTYAVNSDNTVSITMDLASPATTQTYVVGVSDTGNEAVGLETDGSALATIDLQSQLQLPSTPYSNASLIGTYAASCAGRENDLNYTTFDGNGNITAGVDAYYDGGYGDNPYTGTYSVNGDGTFTGNFFGNILRCIHHDRRPG